MFRELREQFVHHNHSNERTMGRLVRKFEDTQGGQLPSHGTRKLAGS